MKKVNYLIIMCIAFIIGIASAKAGISYKNILKCDPIVKKDGRALLVCKVGFEVTDNATDRNKFTAHFTLTNLTLEDVKTEDGWVLTSSSPD